MTDGYTVKPLIQKQIDQAFALVRTMAPEVTHTRWRDFAVALAAPNDGGADRGVAPAKGIMTVQNSNGYIVGLFSYRTCDDLRHGRTLTVDNLIVIDLFDAAEALEILLSSVADLAQQSACSAILANLPPDYERMPESCRTAIDGFRRDGGSIQSSRLLKLLGPAPCRPLCKP